MTYSADDWRRLLCELGVRPATAQQWCGAWAQEVQPEKFSAGARDLLAFVPQVLHECAMLEHTAENLNYSAERLMQVWPSRFPDLHAAAAFAHRPEALADKVYGGRMGNTTPGDGWKFRGRSPIMVTGQAGYAHVGALMGQDLTVTPELLEGPIYGMAAARAWWEGDIPDAMLADTAQCRRRVNGGEIGLDHCRELAQLCATVLA